MSAGTLTIALVTAVLHALHLLGNVFLGNYLARSGPYAESSIGVRCVLADWWWFSLVLMACVSLALTVGHLVDVPASLDLVSRLVLVLTVGGVLAQSLVGQFTAARQLLVVIPIACVALLDKRPADNRFPTRRLLSLAATAILAVTATALTANALAFDAARWQIASSLVAREVAATDIDAGLQWVGYHSSEPVSAGSAHADALAFYMRMFNKSRECYLVSASSLDGLSLDSTAKYRTYAIVGSSQLWVYRMSPRR